jgi:hypothetical protein
MNATRSLTLALALSLLAAGACSSTHDPGTGEHGGHDGGASADGAGGGDGGGGDASAPEAPALKSVAKMMGALHVTWTNPASGCDTIEGERKTATDPYALAFTVPGEADNKHDTAATAATTYTYRLRCKKGGVYSAYSAEMSGNPR